MVSMTHTISRAGSSTLLCLAGLALSAPSTAAASGVFSTYVDFEVEGRGVLTFEGGAGIDRGVGLANSGIGNAWIRNDHGWNAIGALWFGTGGVCNAFAMIRHSGTVDGFWYRFLDDETGQLIAERYVPPEVMNRAGADGRYAAFLLPIDAPSHKQDLRFQIGFFGNGQDAWMQIDDMSIWCTVP